MRQIKDVGEKRKLLSLIFNCRNEIVASLNTDDKAQYNSDVNRLKILVNNLQTEL